MDGKYTRLKLKMLLLVVLGTLIAGGVGIFLLEVVVDGVLQTPSPAFSSGRPPPVRPEPGGGGGALPALYPQQQAGDPHPGYHAADAHRFYLAMGRFTRWLDDIRSATRRLVEAQAEPVELPRELAPIQEDLNAIQRQLRAAGGGGPGRASSARGIWWPSWPTISSPR